MGIKVSKKRGGTTLKKGGGEPTPCSPPKSALAFKWCPMADEVLEAA